MFDSRTSTWTTKKEEIDVQKKYCIKKSDQIKAIYIESSDSQQQYKKISNGTSILTEITIISNGNLILQPNKYFIKPQTMVALFPDSESEKITINNGSSNYLFKESGIIEISGEGSIKAAAYSSDIDSQKQYVLKGNGQIKIGTSDKNDIVLTSEPISILVYSVSNDFAASIKVLSQKLIVRFFKLDGTEFTFGLRRIRETEINEPFVVVIENNASPSEDVSLTITTTSSSDEKAKIISEDGIKDVIEEPLVNPPSKPNEETPSKPGDNTSSKPDESSPDDTKSETNGKPKKSGGKIAGQIIGSLIGIYLVVAICFSVYYYYTRYYLKSKKEEAEEVSQEETILTATNEVTNENIITVFDEPQDEKSDSLSFDSAEV